MSKLVKRIDTSYHNPDEPDAWPAFVPSAAVMISVCDKEGRPNIIPITGWGILCRFPFIIGIGICQGSYTKNYYHRYSHRLLQEVPEFVLNIPTTQLREAITITGRLSGNNGRPDKFAAAGLTIEPSIVVRPPCIAECPINFECVVRQPVVHMGSHDLFLGEAVAVHTASLEESIQEDLVTEVLGRDGKMAQFMTWRSLPLWQEKEG
jgi:flavin reductase (DIM6/NTAB) family NADH-FMN oxidoreductase RutF